MTNPTEHPQDLGALQKLGVVAEVAAFVFAVFGTLLGAAWFIPSPWHLLGALPATMLSPVPCHNCWQDAQTGGTVSSEQQIDNKR
ncbi:MAG: hypothetical protein ACC645_23450 [Pirellulales bacterium]